MALYDENGELKGYRFNSEPEQPSKHKWYMPGTRLLFPKFISTASTLQVVIN